MRRLHDKKIDTPEYMDHIWQQESMHRYDKVRLKALARHVKSNDNVLDVAAGVFGVAEYFSESDNVNWWAIDWSPEARRMALETSPSINYVCAPVDDLPFRDDWFDCVVAGEIVEHMEDPAIFCAELVRVCKRNGWITLTTVDTKCKQAIEHGDYPEHLWEFEPKDLIGFFSDLGDVKHEYVGNYHFIECRVF